MLYLSFYTQFDDTKGTEPNRSDTDLAKYTFEMLLSPSGLNGEDTKENESRFRSWTASNLGYPSRLRISGTNNKTETKRETTEKNSNVCL